MFSFPVVRIVASPLCNAASDLSDDTTAPHSSCRSSSAWIELRSSRHYHNLNKPSIPGIFHAFIITADWPRGTGAVWYSGHSGVLVYWICRQEALLRRGHKDFLQSLAINWKPPNININGIFNFNFVFELIDHNNIYFFVMRIWIYWKYTNQSPCNENQ